MSMALFLAGRPAGNHPVDLGETLGESLSQCCSLLKFLAQGFQLRHSKRRSQVIWPEIDIQSRMHPLESLNIHLHTPGLRA